MWFTALMNGIKQPATADHPQQSADARSGLHSQHVAQSAQSGHTVNVRTTE